MNYSINIARNLSRILPAILAALIFMSSIGSLLAQSPGSRLRSDPPVITSSWDDLLEGVKTPEEWSIHRSMLKQRYLDLIRDQYKPAKVPLDLQLHEETEIDGRYRRLYISYQVEAGERAHAYLGIPLNVKGKAPAVVALHGTTADGTKQTAGLNGNPDKAFLDHLCQRGYIVIAPEHFVSGERVPREGAYDTTAFHAKHPEWTAVGKFNFEHSIAVDVLLAREDVDADNIGVMGHSLGGHGAYYTAAYDDRLKACVCNCGASFFRHNQHVEDWSRDKWYVYLKPIRPLLLKGELPNIDMHEIIALIAPRAYLDVSALNDGVPLTQRQRALMLLKIADVYDLNGKPENFCFFIHGRGHSAPHESRELIYGFLDAHLKPIESYQTKLVDE
ncbi:MAG: dienelactone hydrolase family protein [Pirellula sp.]|nr:dienelactone hydrolase family protein [Pirellula sp.]